MRGGIEEERDATEENGKRTETEGHDVMLWSGSTLLLPALALSPPFRALALALA